MKLYVASSWRNIYQPSVVDVLRKSGHEVYDFRNPPDGLEGFRWSDIDDHWESWIPYEFRDSLYNSDITRKGYTSDKEGMDWSEATILVLPSGRSSHLEVAFEAGRGKPTCIFMPEKVEPELMYLLLDDIVFDMSELLDWIESKERILGLK